MVLKKCNKFPSFTLLCLNGVAAPALGLHLQACLQIGYRLLHWPSRSGLARLCNKQPRKSRHGSGEGIHYLAGANQYKTSIPFVTGGAIDRMLLPFNFLLFSIDCWTPVLSAAFLPSAALWWAGPDQKPNFSPDCKLSLLKKRINLEYGPIIWQALKLIGCWPLTSSRNGGPGLLRFWKEIQFKNIMEWLGNQCALWLLLKWIIGCVHMC